MLLWLLPLAAAAQSPLQGEEVAVYLSKKNLDFGPDHYKSFAAFVQQDDTLGLNEESLKLAFTVKAGQYLTQLMQAQSAPATWFAPERPEVARQLLAQYRPGQPPATQALATTLAPATYLLAIDSLSFGHEKRRSLIVISNQIVEELRSVEVATMTLRLIDLRTGRTYSYTARYDAEKPDNNVYFADWKAEKQPAARLLARLLDTALLQLYIQMSN